VVRGVGGRINRHRQPGQLQVLAPRDAELHGLGDEVAEAEDHARRVQKLDSSCKLTDSAGRAEFIHPTGRAFLHGFTATRLRRPRRSRDRPRRALAPEGRAPNGAGRVPAREPEPPQLVVWHEFLDQRKELSLLKPDVCVKQLPRRIQRLSIDDAGRHGDSECASEPLELHVLDACLAEQSRRRRDVPEEKREEFFFLIPKVDTLFLLKNSTNSLAAASRAEASPSAAARRSRTACTSPS
jgi:hypothetical protein